MSDNYHLGMWAMVGYKCKQGGHSQIRKISTSHKWLNAGAKSENVYVCGKGKIRTNMDIN